MRLAADGVGFRIDGHVLLTGVALDVPSGSVVGLVGPNGSGKSTLLRLLYRALAPQDGTAWLGAGLLWDLPPRHAARVLAAVPQEQPSEFDLTVEELVRLGRLPHQRMLAGDGPGDRRIVAESLAATGLAGLGHRSLAQLSGGERQRAVVARALAQRPEVLLLDEPTNHLDVRYQHEVLGLVRRLGLTTLVALHDLNLAAAYCDAVVVLRAGAVLTAGPVDEVLTPATVETAFGVAATVVAHPVTGRPQLLFHSLPEETP
ncbi:MAG TPA: ABC transporter ATP-binding protein [Acidimicrobiales bacterium]|nr:ABC transporter ATP-binding protein [Acidimicrobiales bacterium]